MVQIRLTAGLVFLLASTFLPAFSAPIPDGQTLQLYTRPYIDEIHLQARAPPLPDSKAPAVVATTRIHVGASSISGSPLPQGGQSAAGTSAVQSLRKNIGQGPPKAQRTIPKAKIVKKTESRRTRPRKYMGTAKTPKLGTIKEVEESRR